MPDWILGAIAGGAILWAITFPICDSIKEMRKEVTAALYEQTRVLEEIASDLQKSGRVYDEDEDY